MRVRVRVRVRVSVRVRARARVKVTSASRRAALLASRRACRAARFFLRVRAGVGAAGGEGSGLCGLPAAAGTLLVGAGVEVPQPLSP